MDSGKWEKGVCGVGLIKFRNWVGFQRTAYKEKTIDPQRIEKLNEIGFEWSIDNKSRNTSVKNLQKETI